MHAGYPYVEDMTALMALYPQVHIDVSAINYLMPRPTFQAYLRQLIEYGSANGLCLGPMISQ